MARATTVPDRRDDPLSWDARYVQSVFSTEYA